MQRAETAAERFVVLRDLRASPGNDFCASLETRQGAGYLNQSQRLQGFNLFGLGCVTRLTG